MHEVVRRSSPEAGLIIESVSARRGGWPVLVDVSFEVRPGEIVAVIGPNGAGKTSLLEAVVGVLPLAEGCVRYQGQPIGGFRDRARVFAFMPDAAEPPAEVRVAAFIEHARRSAGSTDAGDELLAALTLTPLRSALVGELSRGEKRRLMLFGALCSDRPVVVLDEPLGVFDPLQLIGIVDVLRERARAGVSFLMSIHQMADAEKIASRVVLLDSGRLIAVGTLPDLRAQIACPTAPLEEVFLRILQTKVAHVAP
ncbi:MAG: ABC transporter ATP-binding protein [Deltaproteobacteria bacterium]|nr:ABC transporter ATP-binding protein [Deltaproteobacteria bacterium]MBI3389244.1 ABC transporter ATP-binding protein [Deltaproteobacteria bacterium]